jgi:hypothetical protein
VIADSIAQTDQPRNPDDVDPLAGTRYADLPLLPLVEMAQRCESCGQASRPGDEVRAYYYDRHAEHWYCHNWRACYARQQAVA